MLILHPVTAIKLHEAFKQQILPINSHNSAQIHWADPICNCYANSASITLGSYSRQQQLQQ